MQRLPIEEEGRFAEGLALEPARRVEQCHPLGDRAALHVAVGVVEEAEEAPREHADDLLLLREHHVVERLLVAAHREGRHNHRHVAEERQQRLRRRTRLAWRKARAQQAECEGEHRRHVGHARRLRRRLGRRLGGRFGHRKLARFGLDPGDEARNGRPGLLLLLGHLGRHLRRSRDEPVPLIAHTALEQDEDDGEHLRVRQQISGLF